MTPAHRRARFRGKERDGEPTGRRKNGGYGAVGTSSETIYGGRLQLFGYTSNIFQWFAAVEAASQ